MKPIYKVISCDTTEELDSRATALLREGWEPVGGVSCCLTRYGANSRYLWCQAFGRNLNYVQVQVS